MVRTQIQLTEEQARSLKTMAAKKGVSVAALIRSGIDLALASGVLTDDAEIRRRALSVVGCVHSGTGDLSARHDDYLAEIYAE